MSGLLGFTLADLSGAVDSRKRYYGNLMRGLLTMTGETLAQLSAQNAENVTERARTAQETQSVMPGIAEPAQRAAFDEAMNMGLLGITAYHGSPHTFDKFDMSKIGTGEGAQAYGHGLYFAENPNVAKSYADSLGPSGAFSIVDEVLSRNAGKTMTKSQVKATIAARPTIASLANDESVVGALQRLLPTYKENAAVTGAALRDYRLLNDAIEKTYKAKTYTVDIPDEAVAKMLDWDKPLSQQPKSVQSGVRKAFADAKIPDAWQSDPDGQSIHAWLSSAMGGKNNAELQRKGAEVLRANGIPGIRYADAMSRNLQLLTPAETINKEWIVKQVPNGNVVYRGKSEQEARAAFSKGGTSNFVLFDDKLPKIIGRE